MEFEFRDGIQTSPDALSTVYYMYTATALRDVGSNKAQEENTYLALAGFLIAGV